MVVKRRRRRRPCVSKEPKLCVYVRFCVDLLAGRFRGDDLRSYGPVIIGQCGERRFGHKVYDLKTLGFEFSQHYRQRLRCHGMDVVEEDDAFPTLCEFSHHPVHNRTGDCAR